MSVLEVLSALGIKCDSNTESHCIQTLIMKCTGAIRTFEVDQQVMAHLAQILKYFFYLINNNQFNPLIMLPNDYLLYHLKGNVHSIAINAMSSTSGDCSEATNVRVDGFALDVDEKISSPTDSRKYDTSQLELSNSRTSLDQCAHCTHCKEIASIPIVIYPCNHIVCPICIEKSITLLEQQSFSCPTCSSTIKLALVDAMLLEKTQTNLMTRCPYAHKGCTFSNTLFELYNDHIMICPYRFSTESSPDKLIQQHILLVLMAKNDVLLNELSLDGLAYSSATALVIDCIQDQLVTEIHSINDNLNTEQLVEPLMHLDSAKDQSRQTRHQNTALTENPTRMLTELLQLSFHAKADQDYIMSGINESNETLRQVKNFISELTMTMSRFLNGKVICSNCKQMFEEAPLSVAALASLGNSTLEHSPGNHGNTKTSPSVPKDNDNNKDKSAHSHMSGCQGYESSNIPSNLTLNTELPIAYERLLERIDALEKEVIQKSEQLYTTQRTLEEASRQSAPNISASTYMALKTENEKLRAELTKLGRSDVVDQLTNPSMVVSGITNALNSATHMSAEVAEQLKLEMDKKESNVILLIKEMEEKQDIMQRTIAELQKSNIVLKAENRKLNDKNCTLKEEVDRLRQERDLLYKKSEKESGLTVEEFRKVYMEYQVLKDKFGKLTKEYAALSDVFAKGDPRGSVSAERDVMAEISTISLIRYILNPVPLPNFSNTLSIFANESRRRVKIGVNHAEDKEKRLRAFMELFGMIRAFYMLDYKRIRIDDFLYGFEVEGMPQGEIYSIAARTELMNTVKRLTRENAELLKKLDN